MKKSESSGMLIIDPFAGVIGTTWHNCPSKGRGALDGWSVCLYDLKFPSGAPLIFFSMISKLTRMEEQMLGNRSGGNGQYGYYYEQYWADQAAWGELCKANG